MKKILLFISALLLMASCNSQEKEFVRFVVQPEAEINKSIDFHIYFDKKPDSIIISDDKINGLRLTQNLSEIQENILESYKRDDAGNLIKTYYRFETMATPTKKGRIDFPTVTIIYDGKKYETLPMHINIVDEININQNDVKVIWESDQTTYKKNDTIKLTLNEYSRFSETERKQLPSTKLPTFEGKENEIHVGLEMSISKFVGIDNFEQLIDENFEVVYFDWNPFRINKQWMTKYDNKQFIKTEIVKIYLIPKAKGKFEIGPSRFNVSLYKSSQIELERRVRNEDGVYVMPTDDKLSFENYSNTILLYVK